MSYKSLYSPDQSLLDYFKTMTAYAHLPLGLLRADAKREGVLFENYIYSFIESEYFTSIVTNKIMKDYNFHPDTILYRCQEIKFIELQYLNPGESREGYLPGNPNSCALILDYYSYPIYYIEGSTHLTPPHNINLNVAVRPLLRYCYDYEKYFLFSFTLKEILDQGGRIYPDVNQTGGFIVSTPRHPIKGIYHRVSTQEDIIRLHLLNYIRERSTMSPQHEQSIINKIISSIDTDTKEFYLDYLLKSEELARKELEMDR